MHLRDQGRAKLIQQLRRQQQFGEGLPQGFAIDSHARGLRPYSSLVRRQRNGRRPAYPQLARSAARDLPEAVRANLS
jgi:hypothetical protein